MIPPIPDDGQSGHNTPLKRARRLYEREYEMSESQTDRVEAGREILGRLKIVNPDAPPSLSTSLMETTVEHLFGTIWTRPGLELQQRSIITLSALIALNRESELYLHFRGARNLGIKKETLEEVILHLAHYAGWPCAVTANRVLEDVWSKMDAEQSASA